MSASLGAKVSYHCREGEWGDNLVSTVLLTKKGIRTAGVFCRMPNGHCTLLQMNSKGLKKPE